MKIFNTDIEFKSFFQKRLKTISEPFGVFLINGYMGSGKTYLAVKLAYNNRKNYKIKTNIHSLQLPNSNIEYFTELSSIYNDTEEYCFYIIDEIGKKFTKEQKADKDFYNFLQHSRKCKRIVLLIHQEYIQTPHWLRGVAREVYTTKKVKFLPIFITYRGIAYLDDDTKQWQVEHNKKFIYKRTEKIGSFYNTFESVTTL